MRSRGFVDWCGLALAAHPELASSRAVETDIIF
jgi:hypothetical protein